MTSSHYPGASRVDVDTIFRVCNNTQLGSNDIFMPQWLACHTPRWPVSQYVRANDISYDKSRVSALDVWWRKKTASIFDSKERVVNCIAINPFKVFQSERLINSTLYIRDRHHSTWSWLSPRPPNCFVWLFIQLLTAIAIERNCCNDSKVSYGSKLLVISINTRRRWPER